MKRILAAALILGLVSAGARHARAHEEGEKGGGKGGFAERMKARIKEKLELSDEQAEKLEAAMKSHRRAMEELRDKERSQMRTLAHQVEDKASDKDLAATLDALDASRKAEGDEMKKLQAATAGILKPLQRAKMRLAMHRMMGRGGFRGRGHGGGRWGGRGHDGDGEGGAPGPRHPGDEDDD